MDPIHLPQLIQSPDCTEVINFSESVAGLETLTPVKGWIKVTHQGSYLDVSTQADTIVTLVCDRCLQQYNHRLSIEASEMIWFQSTPDDELYEPGVEIEVPMEELVETLPPEGTFDPESWLYEHLCLELPQRKLCEENCEGISIPSQSASLVTDRRWAALESLKNQL